MAGLTLVYFPVKGRVQCCRYILEDNGIAYTFQAVAMEDWAGMKDSTLFGVLPYLKDGDLVLAESGAMVRHLARKYNLYGSNETERSLIDMIYEARMDLFTSWALMLYSGDRYESEKAVFLERLPYKLKKIEENLCKNKKGAGFFVGDKISLADYGMYDTLYNLNGYAPGCLDAVPVLKGFFDRMNSRPKLKAFNERPDIKEMVVTGSGNY